MIVRADDANHARQGTPFRPEQETDIFEEADPFSITAESTK